MTAKPQTILLLEYKMNPKLSPSITTQSKKTLVYTTGSKQGKSSATARIQGNHQTISCYCYDTEKIQTIFCHC